MNGGYYAGDSVDADAATVKTRFMTKKGAENFHAPSAKKSRGIKAGKIFPGTV